MRRAGKSQLTFLMAASTRSRLSFTATSGRPTVEKGGSPRAMSTSTSTRYASIPRTAEGSTLASITAPPRRTSPAGRSAPPTGLGGAIPPQGAGGGPVVATRLGEDDGDDV